MAKAKPILLVSALMLLFCSSFGQNYIGMHKDQIRKKVVEELPGFKFTNELTNNNRSFIKFENTFEEQTLIFMLNTEGVCTSVSRMYNTWLFNRLKDELSLKHGKTNNLKWVELKDDKKYEIELIKGKWFVTVITRPYKE